MSVSKAPQNSAKSFADWISGPNTKIWGIFGLLVFICVVTAIASDSFLTATNLESLVHRTALDGILGIGAAFVIIIGGIDLSIGSVMCLVGVLLPYLLTEHHWPVGLAVVSVLALAIAIGLFHGLLITKLRIQPFVVTLCGLLLYRGIARGITERPQGFGTDFTGLKAIVATRFPIFGGSEDLFHLRSTALILIIIAVIAAVFLNKTIYGRYLLALGNNAEAARYSGINVNRLTVLAYVICAGLAGLGGMLYVLDVNAAQPSNFGNSYELYAIAAAVLGGCSLRGGEGSIVGVVIGTAVIVVLRNTINLVFDNQSIEFAIIGGVILVGVIVDELARRLVTARREAARQLFSNLASAPRFHTQGNFMQIGLFIMALLAAAFVSSSLPAADSNYDPLAVSNDELPKPLDVVVVDHKRDDRKIPLHIYLPATKSPAPVVFFSHGLGGSNLGSAFIGKHWAARGYVAVFVQHPGSDEGVWRGKPFAERLPAMRNAVGLENFMLRVKDIPAVLDQLDKWNQNPNHALAGRLDMKKVGMSGHSFGAVTTQAVSGQTFPLGGTSLTDKRIKAAISFSPSSPRKSIEPKSAFASVKIPWMLMTGTKDVAPIGDQDVKSRLAVFSALPPGGKYELVLDNAEHSVFTERPLPGEKEKRNPNHHRVILALSTAFWDTYLRDDPQAKAWLDGDGPKGVLEHGDKWQKK